MNTFKKHHLLAALVACLPMTAMAQQVGSGAVSLTGPGAGASQDFNTLGSVHGATSDVLPAGWYFLEAGGSSRDTYLVDDGGSNQGNVMSYGTNGSTDRGFGVLPGNGLGAAGNVIADIGARLNNASGNTLSSLQVSFFTEAWLYQGAVGERFVFEYSSDATSLDTGNWSAVPTLDAVTPAISGNGKKDGNAPTNRMEVTGTINGLNVAAGSDLWVRWRATNQSGNDNGLAIDDVVFGTPGDAPPRVLSITPGNDTFDIAIHHIRALIKSNRADCSRRIRPQPRKLQKLFLVLRENAAVIAHNHLCARMKPACTTIIAKPRPQAHHIIQLGFRQSMDIRPTLEKFFKIRPHRRNGRLLEHDFGEPHMVGVRHLPFQGAPWQNAGMAVIPRQKPHGPRV